MPDHSRRFSLASIRRITTSGNYIPEIDGLRFLAIASVLLFHLSLELQLRSARFIPVESRYSGLFTVIDNGDCGVSLFFIISGFVLALPFARHFFGGAKPVSLRDYFVRRITRLEPPYVLSILLFVILISVYARHITADVLIHAMVTMVYLHRLVYGERTYINPVSWSLEIEVQFYIVAPLLMQLFRLHSKTIRRATIASLIAASSIAQSAIMNSPRASESLLSYIQFFLMGLLIADVYVADGDQIRPLLLWDVVGLLGIGLTFGMARTIATTHIVMPWTMALLFASALRGVVLRRFFANMWVSTVGGMCYSIYLMHFQMIAVLFKVTRNCIVPGLDFLGNFVIQLLVTGVPTLLASLAFYLLIERPCMDKSWPSKVLRSLGITKPSAIPISQGPFGK